MKYPINESYCTDLSSGPFCVYGWCDENNKLFYIGKGKPYRSMHVSEDVRTPMFAERMSEYARLLWFVKNAGKEDSERIEHMLIQYSRMMNFDLVNVIGMFSENRRNYFFYRFCGGDAIEHNLYEKDFLRFQTEISDYKIIFTRFFEFFRNMMAGIIRTDNIVLPEVKEDKRVYWTINGISKPAVEWCKQYGRSQSSIRSRMDTYGLTLEQALSLPPAKPYQTHGPAIEQWKKLGLL